MTKPKTYEHVASLVLNKPLLCTPEYAQTILAVIGDRIGVDQEAYSPRENPKEKRQLNIQGDGTLVVPVLGAMTHRASFLDAMSGIQSYDNLKAQIQEGLNDPKVKSILLEMDSPGGSVAGAFDFRDYVMSIRGKKPIYALANDTMASAAYLVGSACDKVYTTQTGQVGSIGVVALHVDKSKRNEQEGIKPTFIYAGDYKVAGNSNQPLEGDALKYLQQSVDDSYNMFVKAVAEARGLDEDVVRETEARVYRGEKAVSKGLADGVRNLDAVLEELATSASRVSNQQSKGMKMDKTEMEQLAADLADAQATIEDLKGQNETLRGVVIKEGYKITAEGVEKKAPEEMIEVEGEMVAKSAIPAPVLKALEAAEVAKKDAVLVEKAKANLPNFDEAVAKSFMGMDLSEAQLAALKAADALFGKMTEEVGKTDADGDMSDPQAQLDAMVAKVATEKNINQYAAYAEVAKTKEGKALINKAVYKKED